MYKEFNEYWKKKNALLIVYFKLSQNIHNGGERYN